MCSRYQFGWVNLQRVGQSAEHRDARRSLGAFDLPDIARAQSHTVRKLFLGPAFRLALAAQIEREKISKIIHSAREALREVSFQERYFLFVNANGTFVHRVEGA